ncbi:hypothetical protein [Spongiimicrobium salis]|uniref:hypothetical protein n=1 Tax=Spongiimicrobium salis TaxID=1667022 RepID=UPI00374D3B79
MRLLYTCSSCKEQNYYTPKMSSRAELQMKFGDEVQVNCKNCGKLEKKHLNKISAKVDQRIVFGGLVLGVLSTVFLWNYLGLLASSVASLPMIFWAYENKAVRQFNSYVIRK